MTDTPSTNGTSPTASSAGASPATSASPKPRAVRAKPVKKAATRAAPTKTAAKTTARKAAPVKATAAKVTAKVRDEAATLKSQATDKARTYATQGKEKATDALDGFSKVINEAAGQVDDRLGSQYGDYARTAAKAVAGFATSIRAKDVDDLVGDARDMVRKSPVIAIGAAAAIGFAFVRLVKSGSASAQPAKRTTAPRKGAAKPKTTPKKPS